MSLGQSIAEIGRNEQFLNEIKEYLQYRISRIDFEEFPCSDLPYTQPLRVHARYKRHQILAAFGASTMERIRISREGTLEVKDKNTELLFINLHKSEKE